VRPGRTLAGSDKTRIQSRDLDADGIPDYVIAHRRKVWIFHGNRKQPQFTDPTSILKVSDDVTSLMITDLNDDEYPDLLIFRMHVPSVAGLLLGVLRSLDIEILARGYANTGGKTFERSPTWRSEISVRIPPLATILKNPGEILSKVEEVGRKFRVQSAGDLDGDGAEETLLLNEARTRIDVWKGVKRNSVSDVGLQREFRKVLFEDKNRTWDLDRVLSFFSGVAERRTAGITGGRAPDAQLELRNGEDWDYLDHGLADLDGKQGMEIVIRYLPAGKTEPVFDIVRLR
jgi:hypothetical protein